MNDYSLAIVVGRLTRYAGRPWEEDAAERFAQSRAAWEIVRAWLGEQDLIVLEALPAFPRESVLMEGAAAFLLWDGQEKRFRRAEAA